MNRPKGRRPTSRRPTERSRPGRLRAALRRYTSRALRVGWLAGPGLVLVKFEVILFTIISSIVTNLFLLLLAYL